MVVNLLTVMRYEALLIELVKLYQFRWKFNREGNKANVDAREWELTDEDNACLNGFIRAKCPQRSLLRSAEVIY